MRSLLNKLKPVDFLLVTLIFLVADMRVICAPSLAQATDITTLVFFRHGEKPEEGLGQLTCQGLNRALALPSVLKRKFGKPDLIYAPTPSEQVNDHGNSYYYVRPLATIEPTAIQNQMDVKTPFGFSEISQMEKTLIDPTLKNKLVFVVWEHKMLEQMVSQIVKDYGNNTKSVPHWEKNDYDSIYIVKVDWASNTAKVSFQLDHEGLNRMSTECPAAPTISG